MPSLKRACDQPCSSPEPNGKKIIKTSEWKDVGTSNSQDDFLENVGNVDVEANKPPTIVLEDVILPAEMVGVEKDGVELNAGEGSEPVAIGEADQPAKVFEEVIGFVRHLLLTSCPTDGQCRPNPF
jgi:hypothetical protein